METYQYIEAPHYGYGKINDYTKTVFLAGSITGAQNWQKEVANTLLPHFNVFNPRRENFDVKNAHVEREQITWEHFHLNLVEITLFYFSWETVAPITLLELGAALEDSKVRQYKKIYISIHPDYSRKNDVVIQTELRNPKFAKNIKFDLNESIKQIIEENG